jgi:type I restriction enzyme M protein
LFKDKNSDAFAEFDSLVKGLSINADAFVKATAEEAKAWSKAKRDNAALKESSETAAAHGERGHALAKEIDHAMKVFFRLIEAAEAQNGKATRDVKQAGKLLEDTRGAVTTALNQIRYFARHAHWLQERFPDAKPRDVEGLVKLVDFKDLERNEWSLTPGRYVGVAPREEDENFDFEEAMREIHGELAELNAEAEDLAATIATNFETLIA